MDTQIELQRLTLKNQALQAQAALHLFEEQQRLLLHDELHRTKRRLSMLQVEVKAKSKKPKQEYVSERSLAEFFGGVAKPPRPPFPCTFAGCDRAFDNKKFLDVLGAQSIWRNCAQITWFPGLHRRASQTSFKLLTTTMVIA
jgi:hypothetical protein